MLVLGVTPGVNSTVYNVMRGYNGTAAVAHGLPANAIVTTYKGTTAVTTDTPGTVHDLALGFGMVNADIAVRRAYALAKDPSLANQYLNTLAKNPAAIMPI